MASVPEIILDNPFRVLGVYANSSYREIVASVSKATKFMEVGRTLDYPLDLPMVKNLNVKSNLTHSLADLDLPWHCFPTRRNVSNMLSFGF